MRTIAGKIKKYSSLRGLLPGAGGLLLCAVSGGADSMCMLDIMLQLSRIGKFNIKTLHFNHGLRGTFADHDEHFVSDYCNSRGIVFTAGRPSEPLQKTDENSARNARYEFFAEQVVFETLNGRNEILVATAHNADDNAETALMRFARGSGSAGIAGINPRAKFTHNGAAFVVVRPLLCVTRTEITDYLEKHGIPHIEDETNADIKYARNRIRRLVMPELREINPKFEEHALALGESLRSDDDCLAQLASDFLKKVKFSADNPFFSSILFNKLHPAVASRVIILSAEAFGVGLYREHTAEAIKLSISGKGGWTLELPRGLKLTCRSKTLFFTSGT